MKHFSLRFITLNTFFVFSIILYNYVNINIVEYRIKNHYDKIIAISNDFYHHYLNTDKKEMNSGVYPLVKKESHDEKGGVIVKNKYQHPNADIFLDSIYSRMIEFIDKDKIKTVSLLTPNSYFFLPFYPEHLKITKNDYFGSKKKQYNISDEYDEKKDSIIISGSYVENVSLDRLRSIFMPIYIENKLHAILMIDLYYGHLNSSITYFNDLYHTFYERRKTKSFLTKEIDIPYTQSKESGIIIGLDWLKILLTSIILFAFSELFYQIGHYVRSNLFSLIVKDSMTNCFRRNMFDIYYKNKTNKSIILLDIDHFKSINDTYGHDMGDKIIVYIANTLNKMNNDDTKVFRWGGEEFLIVLPKMPKQNLIRICEEIREKLQYEFIDNNITTVSLGVTEQKKNETIYQAIYRADIALYKSKSQGRNQSQYL